MKRRRNSEERGSKVRRDRWRQERKEGKLIEQEREGGREGEYEGDRYDFHTKTKACNR